MVCVHAFLVCVLWDVIPCLVMCSFCGNLFHDLFWSLCLPSVFKLTCLDYPSFLPACLNPVFPLSSLNRLVTCHLSAWPSCAVPPVRKKIWYSSRSVFLADVVGGKVNPSRMVVVRFLECEASLQGITTKVQDAIGSHEPLILTDGQGNAIVESEGTTGG